MKPIRDVFDWIQILGPFVASAVALLIGLKEQIINFLWRPKLEVLFDRQRKEYYHKISFDPIETIIDPITQTGYTLHQPGFNSRIAIRNKGKTTARKVYAKLIRIDLYDKEKNFVNQIFYHPSQIKWSGERDFAPIDIPSKSQVLLDLIYSINLTTEEIWRYHAELGENTLKKILENARYAEEVYWNVWIDATYPRGVPIKYTMEGYFELDFIAAAENCKPFKFAVSVEWERKNWNQPDIKLIKALTQK